MTSDLRHHATTTMILTEAYSSELNQSYQDCTYMEKWDEITYQSQTSTVLLKFGNGYIISKHILLSM